MIKESVVEVDESGMIRAGGFPVGKLFLNGDELLIQVKDTLPKRVKDRGDEFIYFSIEALITAIEKSML